MIYIQTKDAQQMLRHLGKTLSKEELAKVVSRSINRTLLKARTGARREVKRVYNISQKNLDGVKIARSTPATQTGELQAEHKAIPLDAFAPKQITESGTRSISKKGKLKVTKFKNRRSNVPAGISIEVKRGERKVIPYAFMIPGGAVRVFGRGAYNAGKNFVKRNHRVNKTGSDTPIKPMITLSVFGAALNKGVQGELKREVNDYYPQEFVRQLRFAIKQR